MLASKILQMRTPAAAGGSDPYFSSVKLLCGFEGTNGQTTFTDESASARTITRQSTAQISTAQAKFGGSSLLLNGSSDYLTCAHSTDFEFGSGQYTIEFFVRFSSTGDTAFLGQLDGSATGWLFSKATNGLQLFADNGAGQTGVGWSPSTNTWYHVCVDRDSGGATRSYVDGVMKQKATGTNAMSAAASASLAIGRYGPSAIWYLNGYMDELRITKGVARYASDGGFTAPTAAFPRS